MSACCQKEENMNTSVQQPVKEIVNGPDPSWRGLYRAGGISSFLYIVFSLIIPTILVMTRHYDFKMDGTSLLTFIAANKVWWMLLQSLVLETSILAIITFVALFVALKHINKSIAALGSLITVVCQILFMAYYPVLLGLVQLSNQYVISAETERKFIAAAAEALIAQNNAFNPVYESLFAIGIMIISLVMLKGVFHKSVAWLGIAIAPAAIIALTLWPLIGVGYFWWWILFVIWFVAVGCKLYMLGRT